MINNMKVNALIDSGSSESYIHPNIVDKLNLTVQPCHSNVSMASGTHKCEIVGKVSVNFNIENHQYKNVSLQIMENLYIDIILGLDF